MATKQKLAEVWRKLQELKRAGAFTAEEFATLRAILQAKAAADALPDAVLIEVKDDDVRDGWQMDCVVAAEELPADAYADASDAVALGGQILEAEAVVFGPQDEILDAEPCERVA